ncbi:MAG: lysophospholipid acyltransferase family protein [Gammaproteobacteria bacterium]|nr:lysophospholipid acyltransferase family protein [Gammaproteobacteria bacterium]
MATIKDTARRVSYLAAPISQRAVPWIAAWTCRHDAKDWFSQAKAMVEIALGETPQNAARIARESLEQNLLFHADYERFARNSFSWVLTRLEPMEVPDGALISGIVRRHRGGVIYATAHVGCYLAALMRIGQFLKPAGPVAVIKREGANAREALAYRHFEALGIELQLLRVGARPAAMAVRTLQRGGGLVLLYDVHEGFGVGHRSPCTLFDRPAALPVGPAALAARTGAMILPLAVLTDEQGSERVVFEQPILPDQPIESMVQQLARCLETWIRQAPGRWMLWPHLARLALDPHSRSNALEAPAPTPKLMKNSP